MEVLTLELPAMYGDHHVTEVRRLLLEITGVEEVYASSGFQAVEITFDPAEVNAEDIKDKLDNSGYMGDLPIPEEVHDDSASTGSEKKGFFRHTAAFETTNQVVSFSQTVNYEGRALWPCPGMAPLTGIDEE
jgi:copper chaperone CopZ